MPPKRVRTASLVSGDETAVDEEPKTKRPRRRGREVSVDASDAPHPTEADLDPGFASHERTEQLAKTAVMGRLKNERLLSYKARKEVAVATAQIEPLLGSAAEMTPAAQRILDDLVGVLQAVKKEGKVKGGQAGGQGQVEPTTSQMPLAPGDRTMVDFGPFWQPMFGNAVQGQPSAQEPMPLAAVSTHASSAQSPIAKMDKRTPVRGRPPQLEARSMTPPLPPPSLPSTPSSPASTKNPSSFRPHFIQVPMHDGRPGSPRPWQPTDHATPANLVHAASDLRDQFATVNRIHAAQTWGRPPMGREGSGGLPNYSQGSPRMPGSPGMVNDRPSTPAVEFDRLNHQRPVFVRESSPSYQAAQERVSLLQRKSSERTASPAPISAQSVPTPRVPQIAQIAHAPVLQPPPPRSVAQPLPHQFQNPNPLYSPWTPFQSPLYPVTPLEAPPLTDPLATPDPAQVQQLLSLLPPESLAALQALASQLPAGPVTPPDNPFFFDLESAQNLPTGQGIAELFGLAGYGTEEEQKVYEEAAAEYLSSDIESGEEQGNEGLRGSQRSGS